MGRDIFHHYLLGRFKENVVETFCLVLCTEKLRDFAQRGWSARQPRTVPVPPGGEILSHARFLGVGGIKRKKKNTQVGLLYFTHKVIAMGVQASRSFPAPWGHHHRPTGRRLPPAAAKFFFFRRTTNTNNSSSWKRNMNKIRYFGKPHQSMVFPFRPRGGLARKRISGENKHRLRLKKTVSPL